MEKLCELKRKGGAFMPKEKELYRDYIERLDEKFPNKEILTQRDCVDFLGIDKRTVKSRYGIAKNGISKLKLARLLS